MPVLPCDPVSASTGTSSVSRTWRASRPSAATGSSTRTAGTPVGRVPRTAAAPAWWAPAAYSWPSTCSPATATNSPPGTGLRLSTNAGPSTTTVGVTVDGAPDRGRDLAQGQRDHGAASSCGCWPGRPRGRRTGAARRRPPGRSRAPCRRSARCRRDGPGARPRGSPRARSPISSTSAPPGATPDRTAARIAAGSSVRGLSSVTTSTSASRAAISPMIGRLPGSRSPPAPITTITWPSVSGRRVRIAASTASGLWA